MKPKHQTNKSGDITLIYPFEENPSPTHPPIFVKELDCVELRYMPEFYLQQQQ